MKTDDKHPGTSDNPRRSTLKTLLVGGGTLTLGALPSQWTKPVVDSVMLPVHAQTTEEEPVARNGYSVTLSDPSNSTLLDRLIPTANASTAAPPGSGFLCIESAGSGWTASYEFSGGVLAGDGELNQCVTLVCAGLLAAIDLKVTAANADGSFDFALYTPFTSCGTPILEDVTNEPCSVLECVEEER